MNTAYFTSEAAAVQSPFLGIAGFIVILASLFLFVKLPKLLQKAPKDGYGTLLRNKSLMMGAIGIFVYVGAEVAIGSYLVNYFVDMNLAESILSSPLMKSISETILNKDLSGLSELAIVGAYLTKVMAPAKVLSAFATGAFLMIIISMNTTGFLSMWTILAVGLFNSIMFPTIFTLAIEGLEELKPQASGILCTMIVGGAIIPPLYGFLTDEFGFKLAFLLVILCYGYIYFYSKLKSRNTI